MAEYIEREGLMYELGPYEENNFSQEMSVILQIVAGRPAADVAPMVHGRWKERPAIRKIKNTNIPVVECSECGLTFCDIINNHTEIYRYCPYCGAKMDMEETDGLGTH